MIRSFTFLTKSLFRPFLVLDMGTTILKRISIPDDVFQFLAEKIKSNVRELEGALNSVIFNSEAQHLPITLGNVAEWLRDL